MDIMDRQSRNQIHATGPFAASRKPENEHLGSRWKLIGISVGIPKRTTESMRQELN
jgi:hypothetical protein